MKNSSWNPFLAYKLLALGGGTGAEDCYEAGKGAKHGFHTFWRCITGQTWSYRADSTSPPRMLLLERRRCCWLISACQRARIASGAILGGRFVVRLTFATRIAEQKPGLGYCRKTHKFCDSGAGDECLEPRCNQSYEQLPFLALFMGLYTIARRSTFAKAITHTLRPIASSLIDVAP